MSRRIPARSSYHGAVPLAERVPRSGYWPRRTPRSRLRARFMWCHWHLINDLPKRMNFSSSEIRMPMGGTARRMTTATIYQMGLPVLVVAYHSATTSTQLTQYQLRVYRLSTTAQQRRPRQRLEVPVRSPIPLAGHGLVRGSAVSGHAPVVIKLSGQV